MNKYKPKKNISLNYTKQGFTTNLFNCFDCGFHSKAISKIWIKNHDNDFLIQLISIHPETGLKRKQVEDKKLKYDGELIEELICGKCGKIGSIQPVPDDVLRAYGYKVPSKKNVIENEKIRKTILLLKKLKRLIK